ncbi:anion permease, partial [Alishewanella longhuensis]
AAGYEKTQFGKRLALLLVKKMGKNTLTLGYAISFADLLLAPFTPSNTARSGGTIFPIISNLPALYGSKPNDPSAENDRCSIHVGRHCGHLCHQLDVLIRFGTELTGDGTGKKPNRYQH